MPDRHEAPEHAAVVQDGGRHALPGPTIWPLALAGGVTLLAAGFATSYLVSAAGLIVLALALRGWVRDLQEEDDRVDEIAGSPDPADPDEATAAPGGAPHE